MSICPRVGGVASYLDRLRTSPFYSGLKQEVVRVLEKVPLLGDPVERFLAQLKEGVKAGLHGGMMFEELGFRYLGPIDGHNIALLRKYLHDGEGPQGSRPAARRDRERATAFSPPRKTRSFSTRRRHSRRKTARRCRKRPAAARLIRTSSATPSASECSTNPHVTVLTAAMCQGNKLERIRDEFPDALLRYGHLRVARRRLCRRPGQSRSAADCRYLQHVPAAELRPDFPGGRAAEPAGRLYARPSRPHRPRRPDASRLL